MNWLDIIEFFRKDKFEQLIESLNEGTYLPPRNDIFKAFVLTPFDKVKVVILGQDPYPTKGHAMGLAFSVPEGTNPLPKTLKNIYLELYNDLGIQRQTGDLSDWAQQGVFLLNTSLTVTEGNPASHSDLGWKTLTDEVISKLSQHGEGLVFVLWGVHAQTKARLIDDEKHLVIISAHPSPLAAYRGFFGSKPFSRINNYLQSKNIAPISW